MNGRKENTVVLAGLIQGSVMLPIYFARRPSILLPTQATLVFALALLLLLSGLSLGEIIYVDSGAPGNNDGSSWADAYHRLQSAALVAIDGDEIRVAQGIYKPVLAGGSRAATFQLISGVAIKGGYAGYGFADPNDRDVELYETILSGDLNGDDGPGFSGNAENSYHVVTGSGTDETAVLDGFTVTGGNANILSDHDKGGGMYTSSGSPTISRCVFVSNYAMSMGGGMFNYQSCPTLTGCAFIRNVSDDDGGGMRNYLNSHAVITHCDFIGNWAFEEGGGLNNRKNSNAVVNGCRFIDNYAGAGGGMENHVGKATATGAPVIANCIFIGNDSPTGGGMRNNDVNAIVINCTFVGNTGCAMNNRENTPTIKNCIFWSNTGGSFSGSGVPTVTFCNVEDGYAGNDSWDPLFVDLSGTDGIIGTEDDDLRLLPGSPCIDAGNFAPNDPNCSCDLDGLPRVLDGDGDQSASVDMGAHEFNWLYLGDFAGGCDVNIADFALLSNSWQLDDPAIDIAPYLAPDGIIDFKELQILLQNWLLSVE
jgi:hypothetical protein